MTTLKGLAYAKVNLALHVTGQRDDGHHLLDSLVVFATVADRLTVTTANDLSLTVSGPFSAGVPRDDSNLVMRAARLLQRMRNVAQGAKITLEKHLPNAAGIGGGSSDAAETLRLLSTLWDVDPIPALAPEIVQLGADLPVCLAAPKSIRMTGIGEHIQQIGDLPDAAIVLVNPKVSVPTGAVFSNLVEKTNGPLEPIPEQADFDQFVDWLSRQRNDLARPAAKVAPDIDVAIAELQKHPNVALAGMSGSGATCWALTRTMADARHIARAIQVRHMDWWVAPAELT